MDITSGWLCVLKKERNRIRSRWKNNFPFYQLKIIFLEQKIFKEEEKKERDKQITKQTILFFFYFSAVHELSLFSIFW